MNHLTSFARKLWYMKHAWRSTVNLPIFSYWCKYSTGRRCFPVRVGDTVENCTVHTRWLLCSSPLPVPLSLSFPRASLLLLGCVFLPFYFLFDGSNGAQATRPENTAVDEVCMQALLAQANRLSVTRFWWIHCAWQFEHPTLAPV